MLVPLSWLGDFLPIEIDLQDSAALGRLGETLDSLGLVVEHVGHVGRGLGGVVVASVLEITPIERADRIRRVVVDAGRSEPVEVVCGAWNFAVGDVVALATVGTTLPGGMVIERRKLRGARSDGMLCSTTELGLSGDDQGILVLGSPGATTAARPGHGGSLQPGTPLTEHLGIVPDVVFDLAIEPNRPDCLSIAGIARDLAAKLGMPFSIPVPAPVALGPAIGELAAARVEAFEACGHLVVRVLTDLVATRSPVEVTRRLLLAGMRPIGSVVDATNYVMLELGQPTHAYDLDRLEGPGISVRLARPGERLRTLDGVERTLGASREGGRAIEECIVTDLGDHPIGLAGVMGGADCEVGDETRRVLLEAAAFDPIYVARAARHHGLRSEASLRFERGVDPEGLGRAVDRVVALVDEAARAAGLSSPKVSSGSLDVRPVAGSPTRIVLRTAAMNGLLGTDLEADAAAGYLEPIGFRTRPVPGGLEVEVPSFRPDATLEVDLIEEVARHHGYEQIVPTSRRSPGVGRLSGHQMGRRSLRRLLTGAGVDEAWASSIVDPAVVRRLGATVEPVRLSNPMVHEESVLRTHLLPGLLEALRRNVGRRNDHVRLFEIGAVFALGTAGPRDEQGAGALGAAVVEERELLGVLLAGEDDDAAAAVACWERIAEGLHLDRSRTGIVQDLTGLDQVDELGAGPALLGSPEGSTRGTIEADLSTGCHPTRRARIVERTLSGEEAGDVGAVGEVAPALLESFEIAASGRRVGWLLLDVERLLSLPRRSTLAQPVSRFPSSDVDLAFVIKRRIPAGELVAVLEEAAGALCESVRVIDVYNGGAVGTASRSVTLRVRLCALDRTLTDREIAAFRAAAVELAGSRLEAHLRA